MTIGRAFPDLLAPLSSAASVEEGLAQTLDRLVERTGAAAGALVFTPPHEAPIVVTAGGRRLPAELGAWLRAEVQTPAGGWRLARVAPPGWPRGVAVALRTPLGAPGRRGGAVLLLGRAPPRRASRPGPARRASSGPRRGRPPGRRGAPPGGAGSGGGRPPAPPGRPGAGKRAAGPGARPAPGGTPGARGGGVGARPRSSNAPTR